MLRRITTLSSVLFSLALFSAAAAAPAVYADATTQVDGSPAALNSAASQGTAASGSGATSAGGQDTASTPASTPQAYSILQPTGTGASSSGLQSADASSAGIVASDTQNIQQSGPSNIAKLLIGGDATPGAQPNQGMVTSWLGYIFLILLATTVVTALLWLVQRRRLQPISLPI